MGSTAEETVVNMNFKSSVDNMYVCPVLSCGRRYSRLYSIKSHALTHSQGPKPFKCSVEGCAAEFTHRDRLTTHTRKVHQRDPGAFRCGFEGCFATFDKELNLLHHFRNAHKGADFDQAMNKQACPTCNDIFPNRSQLKAHVSQVHGYKCEKCDKVCSSETQLKIHIGRHRGTEKRGVNTVECKYCKTTLSGFAERRTHNKTEEHRSNVLSAYKCKICDVQCSSGSNLTVHIKTHEELRDIYNCPHDSCERYYFHKKNLDVHLKNSHSTDPSTRHSCNLCGVFFATKQKVQRHVALMHDPNREIKQPLQKRNLGFREKLIKVLSEIPPELDLSVAKRGGPRKRPAAAEKVAPKPKRRFTAAEIKEITTKIKLGKAPKKRPAYAVRSKFSHAHMSLSASKLRQANKKKFGDIIVTPYLPPEASLASSSTSTKLLDYEIPSEMFLTSEVGLVPNKEEIHKEIPGTKIEFVIDLMDF